MSFGAKAPKLSQTSPVEQQRAASYRPADPIGIGYGRDIWGARYVISDTFNWRTAYGGKSQPEWQYCSIGAAYRAGPIDFVGRVFMDDREIANLDYTFAPGETHRTFIINPSLALGDSWRVTVYRGARNQPVDAVLVAGTGQDHPAYPFECWALWENIDLGQGTTSVPNLALELGVHTPAVGSYPENDAHPYGVNPFAAIYGLACVQPGALEIDPALFDPEHYGDQAFALEAIGVGARTGDRVKCHPNFSSVKDAAAILSEVLAYVDGFIYSEGDQLKVGWFPNAAPPGGLPEITEHDLEEKPSGGSFPDWNQTASSVAVVFKNVDRGYQEDAVTFQVPAARETGVLSDPTRFDRDFIHAADQATQLAAELAGAAAADAGVNLAVFKSRAVKADGTPLLPGDLVNWDYGPHGLDLVCRVMARRVRSGAASDLLTLTRERGAFPTPYVPPVDPRVLPTPSEPGEIDPARVRLWALPEDLAVTLNAAEPRQVTALIDRAHKGIIGATLSLSPTGGAPWDEILEERFFVAKCLATNGGVTNAAATIRVSSTSVDFARLPAQTAVGQTDDRLLLLIENELVSVGTITVVAPNVYDLGILRGRQGTTKAAHADGVACWLFLREELQATPHNEFFRVRDGTNAYDAGIATKHFKLALFTSDKIGLAKPDDPGLALTLPDLTAADIAAFTIALTSEARSIVCDASGTPAAGQLGALGVARTDVMVFHGATPLTAVNAGPNSDQFSVAIAVLTNTTATKDDADTVRCDSLTADTGSIGLDVLVAGAFTVRKTFSLVKVRSGTSGSPGATGNRVERRYTRSTLVPATPFGDNPLGWTTTIPAGTDALWASEAVKDASDHLVGSWSTPQRLNGYIVLYPNGNPNSVLSGYSLLTGDLAFDISDGNRPYKYNGSSWVAMPFGDAAIANLAAGKITSGTIQAALSIGTLGSLTAGSGFGQFWVDSSQLKHGAMTVGQYPGLSGTQLDITSGYHQASLYAHSSAAALLVQNNITGARVHIFDTGLVRCDSFETGYLTTSQPAVFGGLSTFNAQASMNAKLRILGGNVLEFTQGGGINFNENGGISYNGDSQHPFRVRSSSLCLDGCSGYPTSFGSGRIHFTDSTYLYESGGRLFLHDGAGDRALT